jgi:hypothetical protein
MNADVSLIFLEEMNQMPMLGKSGSEPNGQKANRAEARLVTIENWSSDYEINVPKSVAARR